MFVYFCISGILCVYFLYEHMCVSDFVKANVCYLLYISNCVFPFVHQKMFAFLRIWTTVCPSLYINKCCVHLFTNKCGSLCKTANVYLPLYISKCLCPLHQEMCIPLSISNCVCPSVNEQILFSSVYQQLCVSLCISPTLCVLFHLNNYASFCVSATVYTFLYIR